MHGRTGHADAVVERLLLRVEAAERREQRWVDVQDPVRKRLQERLANQTHEAGQADKHDIPFAQRLGKRAIVSVAVGVLARAEEQGFNSSLAGTGEPGRLRSIRDDDGDRCTERAGPCRVDD